jgi:ABC-type oligopeptide transport system ATPase subunit
MATAATSVAIADATKEDMKEKIDVHDGGDDREVGDDDELLDSPRHKKPRRDIFAEEKHEADKKADEENAELRDKALMDTASITDDEESRHSYISTLPPEVPSFSL